MKRGDIYWANLKPRSGSEQKGRRPVLIISHDGFNETKSWRSIIVVPLSTSVQQLKRGPTVVQLPEKTAGLNKKGVILCHQITTLDRSKIGAQIGRLPAPYLLEVEQAIKAAINLEPY